MHSKTFSRYCCWSDEEGAIRMLEMFDDIDVLYGEPETIRIIIANDQVRLLRVALDYFEHKQFPVKDEKYQEASEKLKEILEDATDGTGIAPEIKALISEYTGSDIALLRDVDEVDEPQSLELDTLVTSVAALKIRGGIEECISAAKVGDIAIVRQNLDITHHSWMVMVLSASVHNEQEDVIKAVVDMAQGNKQKATIWNTIGDVCTQSCMFKKAEEYYHKSLEMHPDYYVTYSKIGALYQRWSHEDSLVLDQRLLLQHKAIEDYSMALAHKPQHIEGFEAQERLKIVSEQLQHLQAAHDLMSDSGTESNATNELLSYSSEDDAAYIVGDLASGVSE